jgi:hypothetical protein
MVIDRFAAAVMASLLAAGKLVFRTIPKPERNIRSASPDP